MFSKNKNISSKIKRSKVTDYAALINHFRNTIRVSNGLDPDQDRHYVGPDLDPNRFEDYQQTTKFVASKEIVNSMVLQL